jgi:hypothetical protein
MTILNVSKEVASFCAAPVLPNCEGQLDGRTIAEANDSNAGEPSTLKKVFYAFLIVVIAAVTAVAFVEEIVLGAVVVLPAVWAIYKLVNCIRASSAEETVNATSKTAEEIFAHIERKFNITIKDECKKDPIFKRFAEVLGEDRLERSYAGSVSNAGNINDTLPHYRGLAWGVIGHDQAPYFHIQYAYEQANQAGSKVEGEIVCSMRPGNNGWVWDFDKATADLCLHVCSTFSSNVPDATPAYIIGYALPELVSKRVITSQSASFSQGRAETVKLRD